MVAQTPGQLNRDLREQVHVFVGGPVIILSAAHDEAAVSRIADALPAAARAAAAALDA